MDRPRVGRRPKSTLGCSRVHTNSCRLADPGTKMSPSWWGFSGLLLLIMPPPFNVLRLMCKKMNCEAYMQDDDGFSHLDDAIYRISTYYTLLRRGFDSTELAYMKEFVRNVLSIIPCGFCYPSFFIEYSIRSKL